MGIFAVDGKLAGILNRLGSLFVLNVLTIICCIPVFTLGAAVTALYDGTLRLARGEEGSLVAGYFRAFLANFKDATKVWLPAGGILGFLIFDIRLLTYLEGTFAQVYRIVLFVLVLVIALVLNYVFALMARFQNTIKNTLKNALILSMGNILPALSILALMALPVAVLMISYRFFAVDVLLGVSGPACLASIYFSSLFQKYEKEEAAPVGGLQNLHEGAAKQDSTEVQL